MQRKGRRRRGGGGRRGVARGTQKNTAVKIQRTISESMNITEHSAARNKTEHEVQYRFTVDKECIFAHQYLFFLFFRALPSSFFPLSLSSFILHTHNGIRVILERRVSWEGREGKRERGVGRGRGRWGRGKGTGKGVGVVTRISDSVA